MIATTIEQGKRLIKLGILRESADMIHWKLKGKDEYQLDNINWIDSVNTLRKRGLVGFDEYEIDIFPAWSFSKLFLSLKGEMRDNLSFVDSKWNITTYKFSKLKIISFSDFFDCFVYYLKYLR